jgi:hypothetical protein
LPIIAVIGRVHASGNTGLKMAVGCGREPCTSHNKIAFLVFLSRQELTAAALSNPSLTSVTTISHLTNLTPPKLYKISFAMQPLSFLYFLGIYLILLLISNSCKNSSNNNAICSAVVEITGLIMRFPLTISSYAFVRSSCQIVRNNRRAPASTICGDLALATAGGTGVFEWYVREHPGVLIQWIREVEDASGLKIWASRVGTGNGDSGEEKLEL